MGNLCSSFTASQEKTIREHRRLFNVLHFTESDERNLAHIFFGADVNYNRKVSYHEFLDKFQFENNLFCKNAFLLLDRDHSGDLTFTQFTLCIWNFCTMSEADLIIVAYDCYNNDGHDGIHIDTMMKLVDEATGILSGVTGSGHLEMGRSTAFQRHHYDPQQLQRKEHHALERLANEEDRIKEKAFIKYLHSHPIILKKALIFKQELIDSSLGHRRWKKVAKHRQEITHQHSGQHINTDRLIEILEKRCGVDFGGVKRKRSIPGMHNKDAPPKKKHHPKSTSKGEHYKVKEEVLSKEQLKRFEASKKFENHKEEKHHHAATKIQKHLRRKLTEKRQKAGQLHPHKIAIGNNWYERIDPNTKKMYYFNSLTRKTQWEKPSECKNINREHEKEHWKELVDKKSGKTYYYNPETKCTTWNRPY